MSPATIPESRPRRFSFHRLRPFLLAGLVVVIVTEIVVLSPSSLEEGRNKSAAIDPESLMEKKTDLILATGIPRDRVPEYSIDQFQYTSTHAGEKQWKLLAEKAFLYNKEKIVHSREVHAYLYDPDGKITVVRGREAKYFMNQRDLELFGDVHTVFPDGFELVSDYLRYRPNDRKVEIPTQYLVHGNGHEQGGQNIRFDSHGLDFAMAKSIIVLPEAAHMVVEKEDDGPTIIDSDKAIIHRDTQITYFSMNQSRPLDTRFVRINQPTLFTRSRRAEMHYGDFSKLLHYMTAYEDVFIKELQAPMAKGASPTPKASAAPSLRYATGGRADFDTKKDVIRLTEFPQAYQDNDTVTGDIIIMHRDSDLVEVEHSNAYSEGN